MDHNTRHLRITQNSREKKPSSNGSMFLVGRLVSRPFLPPVHVPTVKLSMSGCWNDQSDLLIANGNGFLPGFSVATDWIQQIAVLCHITQNVKYRGNASRSTVIMVSLLIANYPPTLYIYILWDAGMWPDLLRRTKCLVPRLEHSHPPPSILGHGG